MPEPIEAISIIAAVSQSFRWIKDAIEIFTTSPSVYFVALSLAGAGVGVARRFVPMKKR